MYLKTICYGLLILKSIKAKHNLYINLMNNQFLIQLNV